LELPASLWAASSQLLDVTVFPALEQGASQKLENPIQEKKWEEESGAKASRGAPQTVLQKARLLQNKARPHRKMRFIAR